MGATAADIVRLRRLASEPVSNTTFSDAELQAMIERYPLPDPTGLEPYEFDYSTTPPTMSFRDSWIPTWDMNAAAAEVWEEKAGNLAEDYTVSADGVTLNRDQVFAHYTKMASRFRGRRSVRTIKSAISPQVPSTINTAGN